MDNREFAELVKKFHPKVESWIRTRTPIILHDTEDIEQEVWLKVHRGLPSFRDGCGFTTWLFKVVKNAKIDWLTNKYGKRHPKIECLLLTISQEMMDTIAFPLSGPEDLLFCNELISILTIAAAELPAEQKRALELMMNGVPSTEVANNLGCPKGTVYTRLHHARRKIQKTLRDATS